MKELFTMWKHTRMVVLTSMSAALYVAVLVPFKGFQLIPGLSELRPGAVAPIVFGILFGPAGAWGSAIGNLIGDFFGTFGPFSLFGFIGNLFYGFTAYKAYESLGFLVNGAHKDFHPKSLGLTVPVSILCAAVCASFIGVALDAFGILPYAFLGATIFLNNAIVGVILSPIVLGLIAPRIKSWGLIWTDIMPVEDRSKGIASGIGYILLWIGGLGAFISGLAVSLIGYGAKFLQGAPPQSGLTGIGVLAAMSPFFAAYLIGAAISKS